MTVIRYINTCNSHREKNWVNLFARKYLTTNILLSVFYTFKLLCLLMIIGGLFVLRTNPHLTESKKKYLSFLTLTALMAINYTVFVPLIATRQVKLRKAPILNLFFNDLVLLILLTFLVLYLREAEMKVLVDMGVYKNFDNMNDKEMFTEYDKLLNSAKKMRKIMKRAEKKARRLKKVGGLSRMQPMSRSSMGSEDGSMKGKKKKQQ